MDLKFKDRFNRKLKTQELIRISYTTNGRYLIRENLPAIFTFNGKISWYIGLDKLHNSFGPAVSVITGDLAFFVNGVEITKLEFELV